MKNLPLEHYEQWPFARKAVIFLQAAKSSNEITNQTVGSWEVSYYLLSHCLELTIKAVAHYKTSQMPTRIHDNVELADKYQKECNFSKGELNTIHQLRELNNGPGGLRYDNEPLGQFLPSTFNDGVKIVERLLENFE